MAAHDDLKAEQQEVQRKMGRCLLRVQQYERLLKALAVDQEIAGPIDQLATIRQSRTQDLANKSLGQVIDVLTASYLSKPGAEIERASTKEPAGVPAAGWVRMRMKPPLSPEKYEEAVRELRELRDLRNGIVHHLIDKFDVWTREGCRAASAYLDESDVVIDRHLCSLAEWVKTGCEALETQAAFIASDAFADILLQADQRDEASPASFKKPSR